MRIEELVIEGFKSYPVRTSITGWDPSFNAITGLNGSGKSNILDAICFVLGITNMSQMRAQNQQDLIYKRGQAGITKASVTIVFDNSDRATSPVGLENCKQITVTRQIALPNISKYLLNGHKSTQQNVQTLFQGVQLNINNPNFLIMQGRITKVLNMRPQEILGMVEEASGTRMFEDRKDKAKKTMGKKEKRVEQITSLLTEEITPKLDTLRAEKRSFLQWQKACSELERIGRVLRAWEWTEGNKKVEKKEAEIAAKEREIEALGKRKDKLLSETAAAEAQRQDVTAQRDKELKKGGKFKKLEDDVAEKGKELVKLRTQLEIRNGTVVDEENKVRASEAESENFQASVAEKRTQAQKLEASYTKVKDEHSSLQSTLSNTEELLQTLLTGVSSGSSGNAGGGGYMGQIADAKARLAQASTEEEQSRMQLSMSEKELKTLETRWKEVEREAGEGKRSLESKRVEVEKVRKKVASSGWSEEREKQGQAQLHAAKQEVRQLTEARDNKRQRLSSLDFNFTSPTPDFDRTKVKGLVASLVSLKESDFHKSTALEIAAGGKLYNVVVQDERVGKDLLERGRLKKRVTLIPLNKVEPKRFPSQKIQAATRLAPGKVHLALSVVCYPEEVENAMAFVFGDTFICNDAETAKLVTFSRELGGVRSVTLDGDVYDPSGTLSGGSVPSSSGILIKVQELMDIERKLIEVQENLSSLEQEEERERERRDTWKSLVRELEIEEHRMKLLEEQVEGSNAARLGTEIEALKKLIEDLKAALQTSRDKQKVAKDEIKKLEKDMDEFKNNKDGKIDELKTNISKQKSSLQKHSVVVKTSHKEMQTATLELEQMESDFESAEQTIAEAKREIVKLRKELGKLTDSVAACEASYAKAENTLQEEMATLTRFDNELKDLEKVINKKKDDVDAVDLRMKELDHESKALAKEKALAATSVTNLEKQHEWILEECESFGKPGTLYDFSGDIPKMRAKAEGLEEQQKGLKKKVNMKVINMIDGVEKREVGLKKMLAQVLKDKENIEATIEELDRYKRDALVKTWEKVNGDFGGIFAELLPGNFAKLQPPDGQDLTQGLEVKVRLGSVWKQSLTELSGGQRSLIALSLIMSLLQFKPAPMYILDEIDAALDLSHTQHIGQLFRTRFKGSQFIVVSLKEGLFTNANVLFRTRFRDGTSIVERTAQRSSSSLYDKQ